MQEQTVDLAIVGGGPTGLLTALLAKRLGASVLVFDTKPQPLQLGRADALNARSQQILTIVGILDDLLAQGVKCNTSSIFANGEFTARRSHWWEKLQNVYHKNFLMIGQPIVEQLLAAALGDSVIYSEPVESVRETCTGVDVTAVSGRIVHSTYCVAADGARSMVRQSLGIPFRGTKPEMTWAVLDCFIDSDFPRAPEIITFELNGQSRVAWIPRERGLCRFYILLDGEITEEKSKTSIKKHLAPYRVEFTKTEWFSTFEVKERLAATFVSQNGRGRVILAGDAAHAHSVNGGQGLNTGLSDAFGLGWRLGYVLAHGDKLQPGVSHRIITSFDTERRKVAGDVISVAARLVRDTKHEGEQYVGNVEKHAAYITGMGINYGDCGSELVEESGTGAWKAGYPCPDFDVVIPGETDAQRLYSLTTYGNFIFLVVGHVGHSLGTFRHLVTNIRLVPKHTHPIRVNGNATRGRPVVYATNFVSDEDSFCAVIRPDMYIGSNPEAIDRMAQTDTASIEVKALFDLSGLVAVITGGGSAIEDPAYDDYHAGIGRMITRALAANGAHKVYILGRRMNILEEAAAPFPNVVEKIECDVTSKESLQAAADRIRGEVGYINLLWCNSGTSGPESTTLSYNSSLDDFIQENWKHSIDEYANTFKTNTAGFWYTSLAFLKLLDAGNKQKNVNFSSQIVGTCSTLGFGRFAPTSRFAYGQSKASQQHMMKQLSTHMVPYGIRVNAVAPGLFPTDMTSAMTASRYDPVKLIPEKRAGEDTDIAGVALFIASIWNPHSFSRDNKLMLPPSPMD
ncbi:hypothetical protein MHUMG1_09303 [Metarhizium humberi]|uniref:FAD-binding domain-containing protein n=1 Tax=Metarhizium humberi TaxID=2596975 RepID=A0A9P8S308_9HYPO|nr:hypothetical protein MHUMG1_09303 [Metarhizium humberi]